MKTKREIALHQIELQEKIHKLGINLVTCGSCGTVILHEMKNEKVECLCGLSLDSHDCPDYWYSGCENNEEFNN